MGPDLWVRAGEGTGPLQVLAAADNPAVPTASRPMLFGMELVAVPDLGLVAQSESLRRLASWGWTVWRTQGYAWLALDNVTEVLCPVPVGDDNTLFSVPPQGMLSL